MVKAVIIAAGRGERLNGEGKLPKPLARVAGLPLIERVILSAKKAGIREFVVVIGYRGEQIRRALLNRQQRLGVGLEFVSNENWEKANGWSVLKARERISDDFILLMADHIFDWNALADLLRRPPPPGEIRLAVDRRIGRIFDPEDATKVELRGGRIAAIGKQLVRYDAVDTGLFYCSTAIFDALERTCREGLGSLSEAVQCLAEKGKVGASEIGDRYWQDVDTPAALSEAERVLFRATHKPETDGLIASRINRRISGWITRFLVRLPVTPNQVTYSALAIGVLSGFFVAGGDLWSVALGGVLFQFASIYDGCDGEVAKLKMCSTRFGEWLDTLCDNVTYLAFLTGTWVAVIRQGVLPYSYAVPLGVAALGGTCFTLVLMFFYLLRFTNSGSLVAMQKELGRDMSLQQNIVVRFFSKIGFTMKRDFFAFCFMTLCLLDRPHWILLLAAIGTNLCWILILTAKREFARPLWQVEK